MTTATLDIYGGKVMH